MVQPVEIMRRYTLVFHSYLAHGSYFIKFKRVECRPCILERYKKRADLHFIIEGWPPVEYPNGDPVFGISKREIAENDA